MGWRLTIPRRWRRGTPSSRRPSAAPEPSASRCGCSLCPGWRIFESALGRLDPRRDGGLIVLPTILALVHAKTIADLALKRKLPSVGAFRPFVEEGGLMTYGVDLDDQLRGAATYVDKILKGARPGDLPVRQPSRFLLIINLKTAKALGLTIPQSLLLRADEVME